MILQCKKKIFLVGTNPLDIMDCTIQAIKIIQNSESIIISKEFNKKYLKLMHNKNIYFREDLGIKNDINLWLEILKLFKSHNTISQLFSGDPDIDCRGSEQMDFFKNNNIECRIIPGIIKVVNYMNTNSNLLTNREKNFSSSFLRQFNQEKVLEIVSNLYFEKLVVFVNNKSDLKNIFLFLENLSLKIKLKFSLFSNGKMKIKIKSYSKTIANCNTPAYIIIENDEET